MKDTNAIEKALQQKINVECREIVDKFVNDLEKLSNKYGGRISYRFKQDSAEAAPSFSVHSLHGVTCVLHRMVLKNHSESMLKYKSKELIKKLDLI